jgi:uncharacterized membrane-anchored protein YhcB (DUF1043 family)
MEIVFLIVGLVLGAVVAYFFVKNKPNVVEKEMQTRITELEKEKSVMSDRIQQMVIQNKNQEDILKKGT